MRTTKKPGAVTAKPNRVYNADWAFSGSNCQRGNKNNFTPRTSRIIMKSFPASKALCHGMYDNRQLETISNR